MNDQNPSTRLIREDEAASMLAVKVTTLRRWRWAGQGPCFYKIGDAVRYDTDDLKRRAAQATTAERRISDAGVA